jgi:hypothetical protein
MIKALAGTQENPVLLVDDQNVKDIMKGLKAKHKQCTADYDRIVKYFPQDDIEELSYALWSFLRENLKYFEEPVSLQEVRSPITILKDGYSDCKCYALFIAGILDAKKRQGWDIDWVFRFTPTIFYKTSIGHVFVVVNPDTDDIWIDPVLSSFDEHNFYLIKVDEEVNTIAGLQVAGMGAFSALPIRGRKREIALGMIGNAENDLLAAIKQYSDGLDNAITVSQKTGTINTITQGVLLTASLIIPGVGAALAALKLVGALADDLLPVGSKAAILINDFTSNPLTAPVTIVESLFNGRTYNTDQYYGAMYYQFYVLGKNTTNINQVADKDVMPAMKWFIDRANVFISGQEHIRALGKSATAYTAYFGVNGDTTTDMGRVNPAVAMAQQYWIFNGVKGSWANTVGVFDPALVAIATSLNESPEEVSNQVETGQITLPGTGFNLQSIFANPLTWVVAGAIATAFLFTGKPKR